MTRNASSIHVRLKFSRFFLVRNEQKMSLYDARAVLRYPSPNNRLYVVTKGRGPSDRFLAGIRSLVLAYSCVDTATPSDKKYRRLRLDDDSEKNALKVFSRVHERDTFCNRLLSYNLGSYPTSTVSFLHGFVPHLFRAQSLSCSFSQSVHRQAV
jgi:hypothetical protein